MSGSLYVCATPIGNLEDITFRVLRVLKEVDFIAAEDTRHTQKLLNYYDIKTPSTSYHEHNKDEKGKVILRRILSGENCAVVTDAGLPGISDPGAELVRLCRDNNVIVTVCPGATAFAAAIVLSGLPTRRFCFEGFLPTDNKERNRILNSIKNDPHTLVFYEAPHRLTETLNILKDALGDRDAAVLRELTKKYETVLNDSLSNLLNIFSESPAKGEFVIVVKGADISEAELHEKEAWLETPLDEHMQIYLDEGMTEKEAMKAAAKDRGITKRDVYRELKSKH